ncbi:MAG: hypothetical protein ACYTF8_17390 [Planctomycetota bacterium]|jgi:hypothetical protein
MRARHLPVWLLLAVACGEATAPAPPAPAPAAADGFLSHLPKGVALSMRLPSAAAVERRPDVFAALLRACGQRPASPRSLFFAVDRPEGIDPERAPGLAVTAAGGWVHYLPALDKGALNRALQGHTGGVSVRELERWIVLSRVGHGAGDFEEDPLPAGDLALRVRQHALLKLLGQTGDVLELGVDLGLGGFDLAGRVVPGGSGGTAAALADARAGAGGLVDYIPSGLALRIETTLPPTLLASFLTRRTVLHCGVTAPDDRVLLERFLREVATGIDPDQGYALGLEFKGGKASFVVVGEIGPGPPSPILAKLQRDERSSFGSLILDRRDAPDGLLGWYGWVADAAPELDGLPECGWGWIDGLAHEERGLLLAYARWRRWFVVAGGPRADLLARAVRSRVARGASRSRGSFALLDLRQRGAGPYVVGAIFAAAGLDGLPPADRRALGAMFHAGADAQAPRALAIAGFREDGALVVTGRALY